MTPQFQIKVCGMRDVSNVRDVAMLGVDYLGFIFYPTSPRYVGENFVMPADAKGFKSVGVFVNEPIPSITAKVKQHTLDYVQLHGDESVSACEQLKAQGIKIIKVFSIDDQIDFQELTPFEDVVDYFLFDTKGKLRGGNGEAFDWEVLRKYNQKKSFFLSGGLSEDNVSDVVKLNDMNVHALDFNSGVEISQGLKDIGKIKSVQSKLKTFL